MCGATQDITKWNDTGQPPRQSLQAFQAFKLDDEMMNGLIAQSYKCSKQAAEPPVNQTSRPAKMSSQTGKTEVQNKLKNEKSSGETKGNPQSCPYVTIVYYVLRIWNAFNFAVVVLGQLFMMTAYQDEQLLREMQQEESYEELLFRFRQSSLIIVFGVTCFMIKYCSSMSSNGQKVEAFIYQNISRELVWSLRGFFHIAVAARHIWNFYKILHVAWRIQFMSGGHQFFEMSMI